MNVNFTKPPSVLDKDPYFNNVSLLMHMNGISGSKNFVDSSANNIQSTAIGNIEVSSARTRFGNGAAFLYGNGAGNYIRVSGNPNLAVGTGDYTLEMWAYVNSDNTFVLFDAGPLNSPSSRLDSFLFYIENTRQPRFFGGGFSIITPVASFPIDQWAHLALVRNTGTTTIYVNGTGVSNSTGFYNATLTTGGCFIGAFAENVNFSSNGYIDELRLTKGVARYTSNFTPPATEFPDNSSQPKSLRFLKSNDGKKTLLRPVNIPEIASPQISETGNIALLMHLNGVEGSTVFTDSSPNQIPLTGFSNTIISTGEYKFGGASAKFEVPGGATVRNYIGSDNSSIFNFTSGNPWTFECWVNPTSLPNDNRSVIFSNCRMDSPGVNYEFYLKPTGSIQANKLYLNDNLFETGEVPLNTWTHVAFSYDGNLVRGFINGTKAGEKNIHINVTNSINRILFGANKYVGVYERSHLVGYMDEIRITTGVARYINNFTPPTGEFPDPQ